MKIDVPEQLVEVVKAGVKANREVPGSIALGGTICALFAHHRESTDIDFVLSDLTKRFEEVREKLLGVPEWKEARVNVPVLILGSLGDIEIGYRQLRRTVPMETEVLETPYGPLVVPTLEELIRTKAFLTYNRNYTRDYFDFAELSCLVETSKVVDILASIDDKFQWEKQEPIVIEILKKLLAPNPHDLNDPRHGFEQLRFLEPRLKSWKQVVARCGEIGEELSVRLFGNEAPQSKR
ncbi:MAG TPA: nucleotidyl transferase AbiEii/AbiGii toxin family protein [Pyrinomonadaceae bacterium]|nr:nucleotidyl transferase AbiEii/AbiGii toxin family protein [Pyrinomonadaceae bacterium]